MNPVRYDLNIMMGEDFSQTFSIEVGGVALSLTGATIESQIREQQSRTADLIATFTTATASGDTELVLSLTAAQTAAVTEPSGWYDVAITLSSTVTYYIYGQVTFTNTITVPA